MLLSQQPVNTVEASFVSMHELKGGSAPVRNVRFTFPRTAPGSNTASVPTLPLLLPLDENTVESSCKFKTFTDESFALAANKKERDLLVSPAGERGDLSSWALMDVMALLCKRIGSLTISDTLLASTALNVSAKSGLER